MAAEMTPQERAEQVAHTYYSRGPTNLIDLIADALTATRRAALLEAADIAFDHACDDPQWCTCNSVIYRELNRLAQEGALSIDLSPTIQDDGDYGEHF